MLTYSKRKTTARQWREGVRSPSSDIPLGCNVYHESVTNTNHCNHTYTQSHPTHDTHHEIITCMISQLYRASYGNEDSYISLLLPNLDYRCSIRNLMPEHTAPEHYLETKVRMEVISAHITKLSGFMVHL